jgi:hypothetical protein
LKKLRDRGADVVADSASRNDPRADLGARQPGASWHDACDVGISWRAGVITPRSTSGGSVTSFGASSTG